MKISFIRVETSATCSVLSVFSVDSDDLSQVVCDVEAILRRGVALGGVLGLLVSASAGLLCWSSRSVIARSWAPIASGILR